MNQVMNQPRCELTNKREPAQAKANAGLVILENYDSLILPVELSYVYFAVPVLLLFPVIVYCVELVSVIVIVFPSETETGLESLVEVTVTAQFPAVLPSHVVVSFE